MNCTILVQNKEYNNNNNNNNNNRICQLGGKPNQNIPQAP